MSFDHTHDGVPCNDKWTSCAGLKDKSAFVDNLIQREKNKLLELAAKRKPDLQPIEEHTGVFTYQHRCGHVEHWPEPKNPYWVATAADGGGEGVDDMGCDACESSPVAGSWRMLYAEPWGDE